jgi:FkbM family methyltransferase
MQHFGNKTYSQSGEDLMLLNIFKLLEISQPTFLDIGAHMPFEISNTALMVERLNSRGMNIEPNPVLYEKLKEFRPKDINLNCGVAAKSGSLPFYIWDDTSAINTFCKDLADKWIANGKTVTIKLLPVRTVNDIVDEYFNGAWPDLLHIDAEGLDYEILESANFEKSKPKIIVAEIPEEISPKTVHLLRNKGYEPLCRMVANVIFIQKEFTSKVVF